ncbi:hypothetical protein PoB_001248100 [Plakobranchus ocellatus]|uniref:Uncharacterized protein n=1 Tax=Plakobranchus ocellatus TaxID=259542 RepID=A0AAV3YUE4_9GAST|nr:hypothetical protein PoB_001248100 [Plakobranchus ocellatus]
MYTLGIESRLNWSFQSSFSAGVAHGTTWHRHRQQRITGCYLPCIAIDLPLHHPTIQHSRARYDRGENHRSSVDVHNSAHQPRTFYNPFDLMLFSTPVFTTGRNSRPVTVAVRNATLNFRGFHFLSWDLFKITLAARVRPACRFVFDMIQFVEKWRV